MAGYVDVYVNGVRLSESLDFTATDGSLVTLLYSPSIGDTVEIITYGSVEIANAVRRSGDTFSGNVYVGSNVYISTSTISVGNATVNTQITAGNIALNGSTLTIGNSTVNTVFTGDTVTVGGTLSLGNTAITGTANVTTVINVGANVSMNTTSIRVGNSTVNTYIVSDTIYGPSTLYIDPAAAGDNTGLVIVKGDLQVDGTTFTINSANVTVNDKNVVLASGAINNAATDGAGLTIYGTNANLTYNATGNNFEMSRGLSITGTANVSVGLNVGANVNLSTSQINVGNSTVNTVISATSITTAGNLSVSGNTTLGDASTDTVLMTGAPSIGGAGLGMGMGFRNRIINGAMVIDQRNAGASVTNSLNNLFAVDRWLTNLAGEYHNNVVSQQNLDSLTPPDNFKNYLGVKVTTGTVAPASPFLSLRQLIEGYNVADLGFGTSSAQTLTCSFWARSNLAGTYAFSLRGGTPTRSYVTNFTINSSNTWEFKTFVIPGDTDTGVVWDSTNGSAFGVNIGLNSFQGTFATSTLNQWQTGSFTGSTTQSNNFVTTTGNAFYLAGVQLEKGATATAFDYRPYGTEVFLCQRYYQSSAYASTSYPSSGGYARAYVSFPVPMRVSPTMTFTDLGSGGSSLATGSYTNGFFNTYQSLSASSAATFSWTATSEL